MRIAYLINQYPMVSHVFIRREILALERDGFEVLRIALRGWDAKLVDDEDWAERKRTRYVLREGPLILLLSLLQTLLTNPRSFLRAFVLMWRTGRRAERPLPVHFVYLAEACRIEQWLRAAGIQHVHAHFGTNSAEVAMLVNALGGPQWSFTIHGPKEYDNVQLVGLAQKVRNCAFVIAITSYGRSQLYRLLEHRYWPKIKVVRCGLEPALFTSPAPFDPSSRRLVCVGRLCEQKGQLLLIEAAHILAEQKVDFQLVLVGDGEMRSEIEELIIQNRLQRRVHITGRISSDRLYDEILAARALVLPSFAEGLPMVIMEAMALRRPVVSTYVAGIPELVQPDETGWLVPAGDAKALALAMQVCLETPVELLERMGDSARKRVSERHNVTTQVLELGKLFQAAAQTQD
jgi:glycosyltransferase involved in cell wall biosynthesis